jgi:phosphonopyruvate decarboxylase
MLAASWFLDTLAAGGVAYHAGVPCSYASSVYDCLETGGWNYVSATSEGEAVGVAAGIWLGGQQASILCQNSGLGNMVNPLTSLAVPFDIPMILGVSRRGWPAGTDEPQHAVMGRITPDLLALLGIEEETLSGERESAAAQLADAVARLRKRRSTAFVIEKGVFEGRRAEPVAVPDEANRSAAAGDGVETLRGGRLPTRRDVLAAYLALQDRRLTVATTGYTARELYALDDRPSHFYMVGSMGCAPAIALGLARAADRPVTILDGDGAALMKLGSMATVARYARSALLHVVIDNGMHESTGGQRSNAGSVDFAEAARACGYRHVWRAEGIEALEPAFRRAMAVDRGAVLIHCRIVPGSPANLPRPSQSLPELAGRLRRHVLEDVSRTVGREVACGPAV